MTITTTERILLSLLIQLIAAASLIALASLAAASIDAEAQASEIAQPTNP